MLLFVLFFKNSNFTSENSFVGIFLVAAPEGIAKLVKHHPDVDIYVAAIDKCLDANSYILPGLGDAGDKIFGTR